MTIPASDLKWFKSKTVTDTAANGGRMSVNQIISGVKNNIFPDVSQAERLSGSTFVRNRKVFAKNDNGNDEVLINPVVHMKEFTPGQDFVEMFLGTQIDTEGDLTGSEKLYGSGPLKTDVVAGIPGGSIVLTLENPSQVIFDEANPNTIWIGDGVNQEYHENVTAVKDSPAVGDVTLTLDAVDQLSNNYNVAGGTVVSSCIYGTIVTLNAYADAVIPTSAGSGTFDDSTYPVVGDNQGAVEGILLLTFSSAVDFTATLDEGAGPVVVPTAGNVTSPWNPIHPTTGVPMLVLPFEGWTGTWANGDTLQIPLHPSAIPVWLKQSVPDGTNSFSGDNFNMRFGGESA